jgi:ABC-type transport system involved in cytochrome bd biosynthesis fused ATPase/permease subunit
MMGDKNVPSPKGTSSYSIPVGFVYVFNLIVGAGVLALPQAFNKAGIVLGTILLVLLCCMSYVSACYVIEAMAAANAFQKMKTRQKRVNDTIQQSYEQNEPSSVSDNEKETNLRYSKSLDGSFKKV